MSKLKKYKITYTCRGSAIVMAQNDMEAENKFIKGGHEVEGNFADEPYIDEVIQIRDWRDKHAK